MSTPSKCDQTGVPLARVAFVRMHDASAGVRPHQQELVVLGACGELLESVTVVVRYWGDPKMRARWIDSVAWILIGRHVRASTSAVIV